jgi:integrase
MASINARPETGTLYIDFRYQGRRCREQTMLVDSPENRKRLERLVDRMNRALLSGSFRYEEFFPNSRKASSDTGPVGAKEQPSAPVPTTPLFRDFTETWFTENEPRWRIRHREGVRKTLDRIVLPAFGDKPVAEVSKADLLAFRAEIAKRPGRGGRSLSGKRVNKHMALVNAILGEACERFGLAHPGRGIKALKQKRAEVMPFSLVEVELLIRTVREDYRPYLTVRLLTGLRTGEADGLQWQDIDFGRGVIEVRRSLSRNGDGELKTELSRREVAMVPQVRDALMVQRRTVAGHGWVFASPTGKPIDVVNFTNRVWYPLLRHLGLAQRPPYQMRHTAATLMLASGENPEWVAATLGHSTTEMLFRIYSRFVPNLTRNDGRAFAGLLNSGRAVSDATSAAGDSRRPAQPPQEAA